MAEITIEFTGPAQELNDFSSALFETDAPGAGAQKEVPDGGTITMRLMMTRKGYGIPQFIEVVLSASDNIIAGNTGDYIYHKLKNRKSENLSIRINRQVIRIDKVRIAKMINQQFAGKCAAK
jgi:hypothetical protein